MKKKEIKIPKVNKDEVTVISQGKLGKIKIKIPKSDKDEIIAISKGKLGDLKEKIEKKFEKIDQILFGIMLAVVLSMIAIIISVISLFIDQMRYNNAAYKEYSAQIKSVDLNEKVNAEIIQQNKQNQEIILKQQNQILKLLEE